jgi:UDP-N-acetylmuramoylalanine--D-glutamate ligase
MERIAEKAGVLYVNDSKATNATATAPALAAYPYPLDPGRRAQDRRSRRLRALLRHVAAGYTIGQAGPMFARYPARRASR